MYQLDRYNNDMVRAKNQLNHTVLLNTDVYYMLITYVCQLAYYTLRET
jgi:hypothetical protein